VLSNPSDHYIGEAVEVLFVVELVHDVVIAQLDQPLMNRISTVTIFFFGSST